MKQEFIQKMKTIREELLKNISDHFNDTAIEAHIFGSLAQGTDDALSDIDIWITFEDTDIEKAIKNRKEAYSKFGSIILLHEGQNNFPLNGIQSSVIYEIDNELITVDYYLCPFSSSRVIQGSKILFEKKPIQIGEIIPETKRTTRDISDRVTFLIGMCFIAIKKTVRGNKEFIDFLVVEFKKNEKDFPSFSTIPKEYNFETMRKMLITLNKVSNDEQGFAIEKIKLFLSRVEDLI